jgi:Type II/IV secretion system protein
MRSGPTILTPSCRRRPRSALDPRPEGGGASVGAEPKGIPQLADRRPGGLLIGNRAQPGAGLRLRRGGAFAGDFRRRSGVPRPRRLADDDLDPEPERTLPTQPRPVLGRTPPHGGRGEARPRAPRSSNQQAIGQRMNILVSGGTSSGKTTVARALLSLTDRAERLVTIEDARELHLPHENSVALIAERTEASERTPAKLLVAALRMRPDRLILGEIRAEEALAFLEAINTGHPGSISTIHADSPVLALERLALMVMRAGNRQTRSDVLEYAARTIDVIVQVGRCGGLRGVLEVYLPAGASTST